MTGPRPESRVDLATALAGGGAILLLVSLFLDWYGPPGGGRGASGWDSFELVDIILAALAAVVLYDIARRFSTAANWPRVDPILKLACPIALVLVVVALINAPPVFSFTDTKLEIGIWLGLVGALLMTADALFARLGVAVVVNPRNEPGPPPPPPAPPPPADPDARTQTLP